MFDGLTALRGLDLRRNGLTALPAAVFDDLTELRRLKLAQNALASLPDGVFGTLAKLEDGGLSLGDNPGAGDFVPQITVGVPAQTVRPGVRVDLEATAEPNPWGSNLLWSWARTDTGGETVALEDDDTRTAHFVAPAPAGDTEFAFQVTATGRGTAGVSNPRQATADAAVTVEDTTGPELVSAEVEVQAGQLIDILFSEPVDFTPGTSYPQLDDNFTVNVDGVELAVTNVALPAGRVDVVRLTLGRPISQNQIVTVSYAVPATGKVIEDIKGNDAPPFTDVRVTNNSTVANTTPPVPRRAEVLTTGTTLSLTFNEDLDLTGLKLPPASAFTITANGVDVEVLFVSTGLDDVNRVVNLHVAAIGQRQTVTVSYAAPTDGSEVIEDVDGNGALSFADFEVVNNSTVFVMDATGKPTISGVPQVGNTLRADISGIEDDEGLPATLTYRWVRVPTGSLGIPVGTDIGTDRSYTVSSADVGFKIRVEVSFIDGEGNPEGPLASDAVPAVAAAGACPAGSDWRATMTMGYDVIETGSTRTQSFGFRSNLGALDPATIPYATGYPVTLIARTLITTRDGNTTHTDSVSFGVSGVNLPGGDLPDGTVLNLGATALTVGTDSHVSTAGREQWNLQTLGLSPTWVGGQELTVCANLAPVLESARADGTSLVLTYAEALDAGSEPGAGRVFGERGRRRGSGGFGRVGLRQDGDADPGGGGDRRAGGDAGIHPGEQPGAGRIGPRCPGLLEPRRSSSTTAPRARRRFPACAAGRRDADGGRLGHRGRRRPAVRLRLPVGADRFRRREDGYRHEHEPLFAHIRGRGQHDRGGGELHRRQGLPGGSARERRHGAGDGADDGRHLSRGQRLGSGANAGVRVFYRSRKYEPRSRFRL